MKLACLALAAIALAGCSSAPDYSPGGNAYSGNDLRLDVVRMVKDGGGTATDVACADTSHPAAGVITDCTAKDSAGNKIGIRVTWDDSKHFRIQQQSIATS